jgi:hypothetical protein
MGIGPWQRENASLFFPLNFSYPMFVSRACLGKGSVPSSHKTAPKTRFPHPAIRTPQHRRSRRHVSTLIRARALSAAAVGVGRSREGCGEQQRLAVMSDAHRRVDPAQLVHVEGCPGALRGTSTQKETEVLLVLSSAFRKTLVPSLSWHMIISSLV